LVQKQASKRDGEAGFRDNWVKSASAGRVRWMRQGELARLDVRLEPCGRAVDMWMNRTLTRCASHKLSRVACGQGPVTPGLKVKKGFYSSAETRRLGVWVPRSRDDSLKRMQIENRARGCMEKICDTVPARAREHSRAISLLNHKLQI